MIKVKSSKFKPNPVETNICPAGHEQCNCDSKARTVVFRKVTLRAAEPLGRANEKMHRVILLTAGSLRIKMDGRKEFELQAGQLVFFVRAGNATAVASSEAQLYLLDTCNKVLFCRHYVLGSLVGCGEEVDNTPAILPIHPQISLFLNGLILSSEEMDKPCYHTIKESEFVFLMWYNYGVKKLRTFLRDALSPRDDFKVFVLNSHRKIDSMQEMAQLSNMSLSTFRRVFETTFGETYQSWKVKQKAADIVASIKDGISSNTELMKLHGFKSYPVFYRFCVKYLQENPTSLNKKYAPNNK